MILSDAVTKGAVPQHARPWFCAVNAVALNVARSTEHPIEMKGLISAVMVYSGQNGIKIDLNVDA